MSARILIVEDIPDSRNLLHFLFTSKGFTVITAADGNEGLYLAKAEKPALIIADYTMPDMNGAELIERLRQEEELATVPVLIYTAYSPEDIAPALEAGAIEAFYKPFDLDKLISYVTQFAEQLPDA
jgi:CheY-like chemotaxis protein